MVYFMQEAKQVDDFPRKEAPGQERERARERGIERETFFRVVCAREFFSLLLSLN
jgi:hypothetical protein